MAIPKTMKSQLLESFNSPYMLRSVPVPRITDPQDVLIQVEAASYCHTDAVLAAGGMSPYPPAFPHVGCHEFAGTVIACGSAVDGVQIGDRVGVPGRAYHPCGTCSECQAHDKPEDDPQGYSMYCPQSKNLGINIDGGFSEFVLADSRQLAPLPETLTAIDAAPLMCAGLTIFAALKRCRLSPGQTVAISGCGGGLGHLGLQFAAKLGYNVVGIDAADGPLELAKGLRTGARIYDARRTTTEEVLQDISPVDAVVILPESQQAFDYGVRLLKNRGVCVVVSFPAAGFHLSAKDLVFRDIQVVGSLLGSNTVLREMLQFVAAQGIRAVTKTFALSDLNELVQVYHHGGGGKFVIDMTLQSADGE